LDNFFSSKISYNEFFSYFIQNKFIQNFCEVEKPKNTYEYKNINELSNYIKLKPPLLYKILNKTNFANLLEQTPFYLILLIRSGSAALGLSQEGKIIRHKRITKYMIRKKQGKSQLTFYSKKGTTGGGSKLRLQQSIEFFDEIQKKLVDWSKFILNCDLILYQSSPKLFSELFKTKKGLIFDKKDHRIYSIPYSTGKPTYQELLKINKILTTGTVHTNQNLDLEGILNEFKKQ
jgi:hypothetical protein